MNEGIFRREGEILLGVSRRIRDEGNCFTKSSCHRVWKRKINLKGRRLWEYGVL
jgi:hypothetical protein